MEEKDENIKRIWQEHYEMEVSHLKLACDLLKKHEKRSYAEVIGDGEFPRLLQLGTNKEYVRQVLKNTITLTGDRDSYIDIMRLKDNADFFLYQDEIIENDNTPSHEVIVKAIDKLGQDYRYQDSAHPVKELSNRKKDNNTLARKK